MMRALFAYDAVASLCICITVTGKERDFESGLDYFGARYYGSSTGRFMSPDPSRLSITLSDPETWNRYSYVYSRPLSHFDENGKWPTEIHNQIIDRAFPNLSAAQRQVLATVSAGQDNPFTGGQSPNRASQHAMRAPGETTATAMEKYTTYVGDKENADRLLQGYREDLSASDLTEESLAVFAQALHAVVDSTSPAHEGFGIRLDIQSTQ